MIEFVLKKIERIKQTGIFYKITIINVKMEKVEFYLWFQEQNFQKELILRVNIVEPFL